MTIESNYENIKFDAADGIGTITINRPDKLNALSVPLLEELKDLLEKLHKEDLTGLILTGEGEKSFIAGADIKSMSDMSVEAGKAFGDLGQGVTLLFESLPYPVIAAVNGFALGGGCEMAMSCDFIYATTNAVFGQPEVKLGLIPGFGGTQRLARLIGRHRAKEIIYTGRNVSLEEAKELGLVLKVFETKEALITGAIKTLNKLKVVSPNAVKVSKKVMNSGNDLTIPEGLQKELDEFGAMFSSHDLKEGTKAFVERRAPNFKGC